MPNELNDMKQESILATKWLEIVEWGRTHAVNYAVRVGLGLGKSTVFYMALPGTMAKHQLSNSINRRGEGCVATASGVLPTRCCACKERWEFVIL